MILRSGKATRRGGASLFVLEASAAYGTSEMRIGRERGRGYNTGYWEGIRLR